MENDIRHTNAKVISQTQTMGRNDEAIAQPLS